MKCDIPSKTLGPCDLSYGHAGDQHSSCGDGFYARDYDERHQRRQIGLLIERSSIGEAFDDIKARGIDAHVADLSRKSRRRR